jgi:transglutaminase-like putative cysteine protease
MFVQVYQKPVKLKDVPKVKEFYLSAGDSGTYETVNIMKQLVTETDKDPNVKRVAVQAVQNCKPNDSLCYIKSVFDFARSKIVYVPDIQNVEEVQSPSVHSKRILEIGQTYGDCDDYAVAQAAWLRAVGIKTRFTVVASPKNGGKFDHIRVDAYFMNRWIPLESTIKKLDLGRKLPSFREKSFEIG